MENVVPTRRAKKTRKTRKQKPPMLVDTHVHLDDKKFVRHVDPLLQRAYDAPHYKDRHLVENFFQRIKRFRRVAMRFEKLARNFLSFIFLASCLVWLI